jgi:transposase
MVQLAWLWLRHQPDLALALWFHDRVKRNGGRPARTGLQHEARDADSGIGGLMAAMRA